MRKVIKAVKAVEIEIDDKVYRFDVPTVAKVRDRILPIIAKMEKITTEHSEGKTVDERMNVQLAQMETVKEFVGEVAPSLLPAIDGMTIDQREQVIKILMETTAGKIEASPEPQKT